MNQQQNTMAQKYRVTSKTGMTDDNATKTNQKQSPSGLKICKNMIIIYQLSFYQSDQLLFPTSSWFFWLTAPATVLGHLGAHWSLSSNLAKIEIPETKTIYSESS